MTAQEEIRGLISFYDERGWDWTDAATFTGMLRTGRLDKYLSPGYRKLPHEYVRRRLAPDGDAKETK